MYSFMQLYYLSRNKSTQVLHILFRPWSLVVQSGPHFYICTKGNGIRLVLSVDSLVWFATKSRDWSNPPPTPSWRTKKRLWRRIAMVALAVHWECSSGAICVHPLVFCDAHCVTSRSVVMCNYILLFHEGSSTPSISSNTQFHTSNDFQVIDCMNVQVTNRDGK